VERGKRLRYQEEKQNNGQVTGRDREEEANTTNIKVYGMTHSQSRLLHRKQNVHSADGFGVEV
jgi:hypothetical protein